MGKLIVNEKLNSIKPYVVDKEIYETKLDANESYLSFPEELKAELNQALSQVLYNRYPESDSEEVCKLYGDYCGVDSKYIMAGNGSDEIIQILASGFLNSGDAVLTIKPDFSMYKFYASLIGAYVIEYDMGEDLIFNKENFVKVAKDEDVKLIIFSTPNNPTGGIMPEEDILYVVENTDALVIVDEAYYEFCGNTVVDKIFKYSNLAVLRTCSKAIGLAAARVGFIIAGEEIIENFKKVKPPFNVNSLSQAAAAVILKSRHIIKDNIEKIKEQRDNLYKELLMFQEKLGKDNFRVYPTYSNFVYIKSALSSDIYDGLKSKGIIIRCFGGAIRINAGSPSENEKLIEAMKEIL